MVVFPNAKLNLGLTVTERRADGYHNLESLFYPIPLYDGLEAITGDEWQVYYYGSPLQPGHGRDTVQQAIKLLKAYTPIPPAQVCLYKRIPQAAGLGGGSADGAFTLSLLNQLHDLGLDPTTLAGLSQSIGSDCPFFLTNKPALVTGTGDQLAPVNLDLSGYHFGVIATPYPISTAKAYQHITPHHSQRSLAEVVQRPVAEWPALMSNDFEAYAFQAHPALRAVKDKLYWEGALYAAMTGSGSAFYGIFKEKPHLSLSGWPSGYQVFEGAF